MLLTPPRVLFLCTGNSCRSQMAEGWARALHGERLRVESAGVEAHGMNARAAAVMREAGVDLAPQRSKTLDELGDLEFDLVVTVCGSARERCPLFPGRARRVHRGFDDPPALTRDVEDEEQALDVYRRVRDEIRAFVAGLPDLLNTLDIQEQETPR